MRHVTDAERRARLARRHLLAPAARTTSAEDVTRALTALHATEPATPYLSVGARTRDLGREELDRALQVDRTLVRQLAMRRTLFVVPRDLVPALWAGPSARVADAERGRLVKDAVAAGVTADGNAWLDDARDAVLRAVRSAPDGLTTPEIRAAVPRVDVRIGGGGGSTWAAARVVTHLGATGDLLRGEMVGGWRSGRARWTTPSAWFGGAPDRSSTDAAPAWRELVRRWLWSFGPGTEDDVAWWLGGTKAVVRAALVDLGAVEVALDRGGRGWLLPDDVDEVADPGPWAALLPVLDPTVMGWKDRRFFLGPHGPELFDRNGNAGTTAWVDGRVVGAWTQDEAGTVELRLLGRVGERRRRRLEREAARLTAWLDGVRIGTVYRSPAMLR